MKLKLQALVPAAALALPACAIQSNYPGLFAGEQVVLPGHGRADAHTDRYEFANEIKRVAVIGAGVSGLLAVRELQAENISVRIFERDDVPGGVWHYTDEAPLPPAYESVPIAQSDYVPSFPPEGAEYPYEETDDGSEVSYELRWREHRAPKGVWKNLHSNAAAPVQQIRQWPWPRDSVWELPQARIAAYVRSFASFLGFNSNDGNPAAAYRTRVERAEKTGHGWVLTLKSVERHGERGSRVRWWKEEFDALFVGTGRYNAPHVPKISGLLELAEARPDAVMHSREYRTPERYTNRTVLIIGASVSGTEISRDIAPYTKKQYVSVRGLTVHPGQNSRLAEKTVLIPEVGRFELPSSEALPITVVLKNGTVLSDVDEVIFATGYLFAFPFLPQLHDDSVDVDEDEGPGHAPVVTDGTHVRALFLDTFYIADPTIAIAGANNLVSTFYYSEYQAAAAARVWAGRAALPAEAHMWAAQQARLRERGGYGPGFQTLGPKYAPDMYRYFVAWLNSDAVRYGGRQIEGPPVENREIEKYWFLNRFGRDIGPIDVNSVDVGADASADWVEVDAEALDW